MNDKEIIKALECCSVGSTCDSHYDGNDGEYIKFACATSKAALALINRQQAEIKSLTKQLYIFFEFAGRLERIVEKNTEIKPCNVFSQVLKDKGIEFKPNDEMESKGK